MRNRQLSCTLEGDLTIAQLDRQIQNWLLDGQYRQLSKATLALRQEACEKFLWFLRMRELQFCGAHEIRAFLAYLTTAHTEEGGRWESGRVKALKPASVRTYFGVLQSLFLFVVAEDVLAESPMAKLKAPVVREDQVEPFTPDQVKALVAITKKSRYAKRDEALVRFFFDTGARSSEVCGLSMGKLNLQDRTARVLGKGNKERTVSFGKTAGRVLWAYLREEDRDPEDLEGAVFRAEGGHGPGNRMTPNGMYQLIQRLARAAGIERMRVGPHTLRHTFAVNFLRNGGQEFTLMHILGHTTLNQTRKYVNFVRADVANQQRLHSPGDRMKL